MEDAALSTEDRAKAEHSRHAKKMDEKEQARRTAEAKDRIEERKAQRLVEAQLKGTKALGSVANDRDDDLLVRSSLQHLNLYLQVYSSLLYWRRRH